MKKHGTTIGTKSMALICAVCALLSVWTWALAGEPAFAQVFGGTGMDVAYDELSLSNGNLLLCCTTQEGKEGRAQIPGSLAWLLCLAPDGSVAWEKTFGDPQMANVVCRPLELADGRIAVQYHFSKDHQRASTVYTKYFSLDGEELSETEHDSGWPIMYAAGDGYLMNPGGGWSFVTPDWEPLWSIAKDQMISPFDAAPAKEGCLIVGRSELSEKGQAAACLVAKGGRLVWKTEVAGYQRGQLYHGKATRNDGWIAAGVVTEIGVDGKETILGLVAKLDGQGRVEWTYTSPVDQGVNMGFSDVVETSAGYVAVHNTKGDTGIGFVLLSDQGQELSRAEINRPGEHYLSFKLTESGGGIWAFGALAHDFLVMKVDIPGLFQ